MEELELIVKKAVKHAVIGRHNWSYYKDAENMLELIEEGMIDPVDKDEFLKIAGPMIDKHVKPSKNGLSQMKKPTMEDLTKISKIATGVIYKENMDFKASEELAYAYQCGIHLSLDDSFHDIFLKDSIVNAMKLIDLIGKDKEDRDIQLMFQKFDKLNDIGEMLRFIGENSTEIPVMKFFLYGHESSSVDVDDAVSIYGVNIFENDIYISSGTFSTNDVTKIEYSGSHISNYNKGGNKNNPIGFSNPKWDMLEKEIDVINMSDDMYKILLCLSAIIELLGREEFHKEPKYQYRYHIDHIPSCILQDGVIHYNKYDEHLTSNPFYPKNRKSPRCHIRKSTMRYNPKTGKKDIHVKGTVVNPQNEKMTYKQ